MEAVRELDLWLGMPTQRRFTFLQDVIQVYTFALFGLAVVWVRAAPIASGNIWQTPVVAGAIYGSIGLLLSLILLYWIPLKRMGIPGRASISKGSSSVVISGPPELVRVSLLAVGYLFTGLACLLCLARSWLAAGIATVSSLLAIGLISFTVHSSLDAAKNKHAVYPPAYLLNARTGRIDSAKSKATCRGKCNWEPRYVAVTRAVNLEAECIPCRCVSSGVACKWQDRGSLLCHIATDALCLGATHIWVEGLKDWEQPDIPDASTPRLIDSTPYRIFQGALAVMVPTNECQCLQGYQQETFTQAFQRRYKKSLSAGLSTLMGRALVTVSKSHTPCSGHCQGTVVNHVMSWLNCTLSMQESTFLKNLRLIPALASDPYLSYAAENPQPQDSLYESLESTLTSANMWSNACAGALLAELTKRNINGTLNELLAEVRDIISTRCGWVVAHTDTSLMVNNMMRALLTIGDVSLLAIWAPTWESNENCLILDTDQRVAKKPNANLTGAYKTESAARIEQTSLNHLVVLTNLLLPIPYNAQQPNIIPVIGNKISGELFVLSADQDSGSASWYLSPTTIKRGEEFVGHFAYAIAPATKPEFDGHLCAVGLFTSPKAIGGNPIQAWRLGAA
ncbi:hypothetical protein K493DRAFT_301545 [Basidiobolus meristosporus CBS 931.73]|uniref:Transmembrane protein n=1 Tax=Basidiobolus meristosporus CBS 931.73 TaxID=1314790 RepID=A0A1Y1YBG6_9FUNG|nr:hypothetical protein K493DRAFT_301545 [Basidiobolus meristosporus CBS 931.73]|eukprot:ORX95349.1 hypothetical protein K493DRAFT_301545 [Basidiobolus meristosporus CBS 931.73]